MQTRYCSQHNINMFESRTCNFTVASLMAPLLQNVAKALKADTKINQGEAIASQFIQKRKKEKVIVLISPPDSDRTT